jgi:hypothetical protein
MRPSSGTKYVRKLIIVALKSEMFVFHDPLSPGPGSTLSPPSSDVFTPVNTHFQGWMPEDPFKLIIHASFLPLTSYSLRY